MDLSKLKIEARVDQETVVLRLIGDLMSDSVPYLAQEIKAIEAKGLGGLHLDFSELRWIDSRAVGALVGWHRHFTVREIEFRLLHVKGRPLGVLQVCNLTSFFDVGPPPADEATRIRWQREALWESHEYGEQVVAALGEGLLGIDPQGKILFANPSAEKFLGLREWDLLGRSLYEAVSPVDAAGEAVPPDECALLQVTRGSTEVFHGEVYLQLDRPAPVAFGANVTPVFRSGHLVGAVIGLLDISARKQAEEALLHASRMEAAATLAGGVAHDFNNLMVGVLGNADLLKMHCANQPDAMRMLAGIAQSAQRAGALALQMLVFAGGGQHHPQVIHLEEIIQETLRLQKRFFPPRIRIERDIEANLWNVEADPAQMSQLLMNLCINAVEATESEGRLVIRARNLDVSEREAGPCPGMTPGRYVCLSVEDTGCGMEPKIREKMFEPFFTTKFQGRGLGLAAVHGIVKHHQGHISVSSESDRGTILRIVLPATEAPVPGAAGVTSNLPTGTETILVIDDEQVVLEVTRKILERLGYQVVCARNGQEGIEIAREFEGDIHLVLLDMGMPVMGGEAACPLLMDARPRMRTIICSGYDLDASSQRLLDAGADAFLQKPFRVESLARQVREVLDR